MSDPNHQSCWCPHNCGDIDKRIDERIAKALERLAAEWGPLAARSVAAELRAAEPASERAPSWCNACMKPWVRWTCAGHKEVKPAPPPSLVERLRSLAKELRSLNHMYARNEAVSRDAAKALDEAADALEDAEVERDRLNLLEQSMAACLKPFGVRYMDPPDGGSVSLIEQIQRMANDLEAAQAEAAELRDWRRVGRESADKLSAEFNRVRELEAQLSVAQADTRRLDALERWAHKHRHANVMAWLSIAINPGETLRSVADALAATMERKP